LLRETASAMELPVDEIVPSEEEMEKKEAAQAQAAQAQAQAQAQAGQAQEQAIAQRESQGRQEALIADIVKQVIAAQAKPQPAAAAPQRQLAAA
jgi:hypothetical protein